MYCSVFRRIRPTATPCSSLEHGARARERNSSQYITAVRIPQGVPNCTASPVAGHRRCLALADVTTGACLAAVLFRIGQQLIGLYLGQSSVASSYGATGSVMILLLWVYYSCQILLLGAEFTRAYAMRQGTQPAPESFAERDLVALSEAT